MTSPAPDDYDKELTAAEEAFEDAEARWNTILFAREIVAKYGDGAVDWCLEQAAKYSGLQNYIFESKMIELVGIISREQSPRLH